MRHLLIGCLLLLTVVACIDQITLPINNRQAYLVVEGLITNEPPPYTVRLTFTNPVGQPGANSPVRYTQQALVKLTDDSGRTTQLADQGQGVYQTLDSTFRGQVGRAYSLSVQLADGSRYVSAPERMPAVPAIDSITASVARTSNFSLPYTIAYSVYVRDPAQEKNFYCWRGSGYTIRLSVGDWCDSNRVSRCNNRCWTPYSSNQFELFSDAYTNGNAIRGRMVLQIPIYATGPQLAEIQQYGITQSYYQFLQLYQQEQVRTGSIFDPLPTGLLGNLVSVTDPTQRARGYFAVSSLTRNYDYSSPFYGALTSYLSSLPLPPRDCRDTYGQIPVMLPEGW